MQRKIKTVVVSAVVGFALFGTNLTQATAPTQISVYSKAQLSYDIQINQWLDKLETQESGGKANLDHLDTNGKYSRGCYQFQDSTFARYSALLDVSGSVYDCAFSRHLTRLIVENDYSAWSNWSNSVKVIGKPPHR